MKDLKLGFALCGSFCTIKEAVEQIEYLKGKGADITPIMSEIVQCSNTRFTNAEELKNKIESICEKQIISTVVEAEPIGPKRLFDALIVCPCTGNTLAKLNLGITDNTVTMAVKAHLRNNRPVILAIATNDALGGSAKNIGGLLNTKNIYFVPFRQDDPKSKEKSIIADYKLLEPTVLAALDEKQFGPLIV